MTPEQRAQFEERLRLYSRKFWEAHKRDIIESRRQRIEAMTPEQRAQFEERLRLYSRDWRRAWRERMLADPEARREYRAQQAKGRADRALRQLFALSAKLEDLTDE